MTDAVVPNQELALSEAPRSSVDASVFQRLVAIARGLEQLGSGMEDLAVPFAKQAAQDDARTEMTLDANGQPQAASPLNSVILGKAGQEYQDVLQQGIQAGLHAKIQTDVAQLHAQNPTDIDAFKASLQGYSDHYRALYPGQIGDGLANLANDYGAQHATNIVESTVTRDAQESLQAIQTNIDTNLNWLKAAARQGAVDTDAYKMKQAELSDAYDQLGTNKLYGYSPEKIAAEKDNSIDLLNGEYVVGQIDQTFNRKGKAAAAEAIKTSIDNNPDLDLSDAQRNNLHNYAMSRLDYLTNEQASSIAALKPTADLQVKALQSGNSGPNAIPEREIDATVAQLRSLGAFKEADQLDTARIVADRTVAFRNLMPDQKEQVLFGAAGAGVGGPVASGINTEQGAVQYFVSQGWSPAQAAGIVGNLVHESGGKLNPAAANRGDGADGSDSIGIGQWNNTRAADLKTFAAAQGKPWQDLGVQLAFVQHELTGSESAAAAKLKGASTAQDAASAFALGYERPQGFQTGDMTQVAGGQNRIDQATRIAAGGGSSTNIPGAAGVATVGTPYSDTEAQKNAWYTAAFRQQVQVDDATQIRYAKASMETLQNSIKFTGNPSPDMIPQASAALQIADAHPDQLGAEATKLRGALAGSRAGFAAADQPDGGQNLLDQVNQFARSGDPFYTSLAEHAKASVELGKKMLADDPYSYGVQAEIIPRKPVALQFAQPAQGDQPAVQSNLPQAISERSIAATKIAAMQKLAGRPIFDNADLPQVKSVMTSGTTDQRLSLLAAISNAPMSEATLKATLAQLGQSKETLPLAVAGTIARDNPQAARDVLVGQQVMQVDPKLAPNKDDYPSTLAKILPFNDLPNTGARQGIDQATQAYYAKLSADANDTTGVLNEDRVQKAFDAVTGGSFFMRGSTAIAPWYGAKQEGADAAIRSLTDADLANARTADGAPFPASALKPSLSAAFTWNNWRLESYGDGKYLIFSGPDTNRQYVSDARGGKFVLNLGAKKDQAQRDGLGLADTFYSPMASGAYYGGGN